MTLTLAILFACSDPSTGTPAGTDPSTPAPTTTPEPATDPTTGEVLETYTMELEMVEASGMPLVISGYTLACSDDSATVGIETVGEPTSVELVAWVDGVPGDVMTVPMIDATDAMRIHPLRLDTADCAATTWQMMATSASDDLCVVYGPDAANISAQLVDCPGR